MKERLPRQCLIKTSFFGKLILNIRQDKGFYNGGGRGRGRGEGRIIEISSLELIL